MRFDLSSLAFVRWIHRDRWIPRTNGQSRGNVSIWRRHHDYAGLAQISVFMDGGWIISPSHYLNQCWNIVNWTLENKFQWNLNQNLFSFEKMCLEMTGNWWPFCLCLNVLNTFKIMKSWVWLHRPYLTYVYHWIDACVANGSTWFTCSFILYIFFSHTHLLLCCHKRG